MKPSESNHPDEQTICELVQLALDNRLDEQQRHLLNELLRNSKAARRCYLECLAVQVGMKRVSQLIEKSLPGTDMKNFDPAMWQALAEDERTAEAVELLPKTQPEPLIQKVEYPNVTRPASKASLIVAAISLAALFIMVTYVMLNPQSSGKAIAVIADMAEPKWVHVENMPHMGQTIYDTTYDLNLASGIVKLRYDSGTEVLIEGPAVFSCQTPQTIQLRSGKAYTKVSHSAIGFTVVTPSCNVIDLGTQFGTAVQADGNSIVQMYEGKASLVGDSQNQASKPVTLKQNQARIVDAKSGSIQPVPFDPQAFVRHIDSAHKMVWDGCPLDLGDVVGGGNGFGTGLSGGGIDPKTGQFNAKYVRYGRMHIAKEAFWSPVPSNPFVDCIFVTDGSEGPQKVTTRGHLFGDFVKTDRRYHHDIFYSSSSKTMLPADEEPEDQNVEITLGGVRYGVKERPAIFIHAPLGITFDLAAVRQSLPGLEISSFQSVVGIPDTDRDGATLDIIVLVDGDGVFRKDLYTVAEPSVALDIPLSPGNRFLTLAVTDGGDGAWWDLCVFGQPRLELINK